MLSYEYRIIKTSQRRNVYERYMSILARVPATLSFVPLAEYVIVSIGMDHEVVLDWGTITLVKSPVNL